MDTYIIQGLRETENYYVFELKITAQRIVN